MFKDPNEFELYKEMIKKFALLISAILLSINFITAQSHKPTITDEKFNEHKTTGDRYYADEEYYLAAQEYLKAAKLRANDPYVDYTLAECYRKNYDYDDAEKWYEKTYSMHNTHYPLAQFWYGMMQKTNGKYIEAEKSIDAFVKSFKPVTEEDRIRLREAEFEYKGCVFAIEQLKKPIKEIGFSVLPPPVNSKSSDYSPMLFFHDSSIVITSARSDAKGGELNLATGEARSDNFRFEKKGNKWERMHNNDNFDIVNTSKDDGAGELTKDKTKYYYTICDPECGIYVSKTVNGKFTKAVKLNRNINATGYWNAQPTLSPTADTMFFVSKRPGGRGQQDIWMSVNKDKTGATEEWSPAMNMVSINTAFVELSPFWDDHTNTIYFASNGHEGFGGLDVYVAKGTKRDSIVNMGLPFNSNRDDLYFALGKEKGYVVSNRKGGIGSHDIYTFDIRAKESVVGEIAKNSFADAQSVSSIGRIIYNDTQLPMAGATVFLKDEAGAIVKEAKTNANGEFRFDNLPPDKNFRITMMEGDSRVQAKLDYEVEKKPVEATPVKEPVAVVSTPVVKPAPAEKKPAATKPKKVEQPLAETVSVSVPEVVPVPQSSVSGVKSNVTVEQFKIKSSSRKPSRVLFDNVYFDFNSIDLNPPARKALDDLLKYYGDHKEIQIEIKAYTDGYGDLAYNKQLALQRGQACYDYLAGRGVDQTALLNTPVGMGNFLGNNNSFTGRQLNRRVEFSIVGAKEKYETEAMAYVIEPKMTLYSISKKFNMTVDELKKMNGISAADIKAYSAIRVRRGAGDADIIAPVTIANMQEGKQEYKFREMQFIPSAGTISLGGEGEGIIIEQEVAADGYYIVQPKETLYSIAKKHNLTVDRLKQLNNIVEINIYVGQKLKIK